MKEFFKPEDFSFSYGDGKEEVCRQANVILNKLIESSPMVYRSQVIECDDWSNEKMKGYTQQARLMFIEEIKREPCKHEPDENNVEIYSDKITFLCKKCNYEQVATWGEKK